MRVPKGRELGGKTVDGSPDRVEQRASWASLSPTHHAQRHAGQLHGGTGPHRFQRQQKYFLETLVKLCEVRLDVQALNPFFLFLPFVLSSPTTTFTQEELL